jgi:hypothetical protein
MNKKTIITALLALVSMGVSARGKITAISLEE